MGFLDSVVVPDEVKTKIKGTSSSGFLNSVSLPTNQTRANQLSAMSKEASDANRLATKEQSIGGVATNALKTITSPVKTFAQGAVEGYKSVPIQEKSFSGIFTGKAPEAGWKVSSDTLSDSANRIEDWGQTISDSKASTASKIAKTGSVGVGWLNNAFTAVTAPLATLSTIPGIGRVADKVNQLFGAIGGGASKVAIEDGVKNLPVSQQTKDEITPLVGELAALAGMIAAGKAGSVAAGKFKTQMKVVTEKIATEVKAQGVASAPQVKGGFLESVIAPERVAETKNSSPTGETRPSVPLETPEKATSKLALDIETKLKTELADLPEYNTMNMKEQARLATELLAKDPAFAKEVAMGEKPAPSGLREGSVFIALREKAIAEGDAAGLIDLANSKLASEASILGQRIKAFDDGTGASNPLKEIQAIKKERVMATERKTGVKVDKAKADTVKEIQTEMRKDTPSKQTWEDFIKSLECGY